MGGAIYTFPKHSLGEGGRGGLLCIQLLRETTVWLVHFLLPFPTLHNNSCGLLPYIRKLKASRVISEAQHSCTPGKVLDSLYCPAVMRALFPTNLA